MKKLSTRSFAEVEEQPRGLFELRGLLSDGRRTTIRARFECFVYAHDTARMALMMLPAGTRVEILRNGAVIDVVDADSAKQRCWQRHGWRMARARGHAAGPCCNWHKVQ